MISGCKTVAEYSIKNWMEKNNFEISEFSLFMNGNEGKITDKTGSSMFLVYDPETKSVNEKLPIQDKLAQFQKETGAKDSAGKSGNMSNQ